MGKAAAPTPSYIRREASLFPLLSFSLPSRALSAPTGHLPHWGGRANGRSFDPACASNECAFAGSWRDVPYKYAALRVLTQCTTSLKAGMSDRAPLRFPHLSFIRLETYPARYARHLPHAGKALLQGRRCSRFAVFPMGKAVHSFSALETHFPTLFHTASTLSASTGHLPRGADDTREPAIADLRASPDLYCGEAATTALNLAPIIFPLPSKKNPLSQVLFAYLPFISC